MWHANINSVQRRAVISCYWHIRLANGSFTTSNSTGDRLTRSWNRQRLSGLWEVHRIYIREFNGIPFWCISTCFPCLLIRWACQELFGTEILLSTKFLSRLPKDPYTYMKRMSVTVKSIYNFYLNLQKFVSASSMTIFSFAIFTLTSNVGTFIFSAWLMPIFSFTVSTLTLNIDISAWNVSWTHEIKKMTITVFLNETVLLPSYRN